VQPLRGIVVVAVEQAVAAPICTRHLGDLGARVIKVENITGTSGQPAWAAARPLAECREAAGAAGLGHARLNRPAEVLDYPQLTERGRWQEMRAEGVIGPAWPGGAGAGATRE
jgi:crotonobetainyl-CoA:carnitine CoA-transferase CaiB-like acyl-CoA transferase